VTWPAQGDILRDFAHRIAGPCARPLKRYARYRLVSSLKLVLLFFLKGMYVRTIASKKLPKASKTLPLIMVLCHAYIEMIEHYVTNHNIVIGKLSFKCQVVLLSN
jgi:hypothetical protein